MKNQEFNKTKNINRMKIHSFFFHVNFALTLEISGVNKVNAVVLEVLG
jgi:hypothetical protein